MSAQDHKTFPSTDARTPAALEMYRAGESMLQIQKKLGLAQVTLRRIIDRAGLPPRIAGINWPEERVAKLRQMAADGMTFGEMAKRLGVTRCSVIGKAHRLGVVVAESARQAKPSMPTLRPRTLPKVEPVAKAAQQPAAFKTANGRVYPQKPSKPLPPRLVIGGHGAVTIHEQREPVVAPPKALAFVALPGTTPQPFGLHRAHFCKWPIHDPADTDDIARLSCGEPCEGRYCPTHTELGKGKQMAPLRDLYDPAVTRIRGPGSARISA